MTAPPLPCTWDRAPVTREYVFDRLTYDPLLGSFTWRRRTGAMFVARTRTVQHECAIWNAKYAGKPAGRINPSVGYLEISIDGKRYGAHRLAFLLMVGRWPEEVDHINRIRADNRWVNLREASRVSNTHNTSSHKGSTSQFVGVSWNGAKRKWQAAIGINRKSVFIGRFDTEEEASAAYLKRKRELHPLAVSE